jgi:hypothetical protein
MASHLPVDLDRSLRAALDGFDAQLADALGFNA